MNGTSEQLQGHETFHAQSETRPYKRVVAGGSMMEALGGLGAVVLTILGLARVYPIDMAAISVIAIGASLLFDGGAIGARFSRLLAATGSDAIGTAELGGGITAEFLGGAAGIVLGLLSLLGMAPVTLCPVAAIVFGGALLLGSGATARLNVLEITAHTTHARAEAIVREAVTAAAGAQVLTGLAAILLGILALVGFNPSVMTLVALLCLGASVVLSGSAISGRVLSRVIG
jgi:hypothetical protein